MDHRVGLQRKDGLITLAAFRSFREQTLHYMVRDNEADPVFPVSSPACWRPSDFDTDQPTWLIQLSDEDVAELSVASDELIAKNTEMAEVNCESFRLPTLATKVESWRLAIQHGPGFVVVRGLPVDAWGQEKSAYAYWGLGHHIGVPGAQNPQNELLGHVIDYDEEKTNANVRRYRTSGNIDFHCDAADVVGLLCLNTAMSGGQSRIASSVAVFNEIYRHSPELAKRLFQPFHLDRRGEHRADESPYSMIAPCAWSKEKGLQTFYHSEYFRSAERHKGVEFDAETTQVLDLYDQLCASPDFHLDMWLQPGDMQFISNHTIVHARTEYEDWPEPDRRRHLLRLWLSL